MKKLTFLTDIASQASNCSSEKMVEGAKCISLISSWSYKIPKIINWKNYINVMKIVNIRVIMRCGARKQVPVTYNRTLWLTFLNLQTKMLITTRILTHFHFDMYYSLGLWCWSCYMKYLCIQVIKFELDF